MGVFSVPITVRNWQNKFLPPEKQGEEIFCNAVVSTAAAEFALPPDFIERLKLEEIGHIGVLTADGGRYMHRIFGMVEIELQGRRCQVRVIEFPRGSEPLLGAVPLAAMDWRVSTLAEKVLPNPDSPDMPLLPMF